MHVNLGFLAKPWCQQRKADGKLCVVPVRVTGLTCLLAVEGGGVVHGAAVDRDGEAVVHVHRGRGRMARLAGCVADDPAGDVAVGDCACAIDLLKALHSMLLAVRGTLESCTIPQTLHCTELEATTGITSAELLAARSTALQ